MDLRTTYLGLELPHPLMPGASPLPDVLDRARRLEDAGAAAIVMRSLFEEQIVQDDLSAGLYLEGPMESYAEALSYFPNPEAFALGPFEYLEHLRRLRQAVSVPLIASLNGTTLGGWLEYAQFLQDAGADALELNVYRLPVTAEEDAVEVERETAEMVTAVKHTVRIPVAVKLSPFYTSLPAFTARLARAGADGFVLFNRFLQPDIDVEELRAMPQMELSHPEELETWLTEHEYASLRQMRGSMNLAGCPNPGAYERAHYMRILQSRHGD